jgi:hypothetical protein
MVGVITPNRGTQGTGSVASVTDDGAVSNSEPTAETWNLQSFRYVLELTPPDSEGLVSRRPTGDSRIACNISFLVNFLVGFPFGGIRLEREFSDTIGGLLWRFYFLPQLVQAITSSVSAEGYQNLQLHPSLAGHHIDDRLK